ncbi:hypothetical protein ACJIZ3_012115 [Penstemon smallii]|uniref:Gamma-tubulin complex component n=1 Tax=Penstemon smallii TaxID=265156 RepID=A0ABD3UQE6_9LAMI
MPVKPRNRASTNRETGTSFNFSFFPLSLTLDFTRMNAAMDSLLLNLKLDEPWVSPRSWDSLPSRGASSHSPSHHPPPALYTSTAVSEQSLVRLAMNALQGVESALISIRKLSALLRYRSADRTSHRITSLWTRCSSTSAIADLLISIGQFGCIVFLLRVFVNYFTTLDFDGVRETDEKEKCDTSEEGKGALRNCSLINQAFAISVGKVIDGYISALNTISESASLRRCSKSNNGGCLTSVGHSEVTLLEVYLHTAGLRTQIESLGNICNVNHLSIIFPVSSFGDLITQANSEFSAFPRGGALLSFLYAQLKVADPDHCTLLKFLFLQSYEPYCGFIRSWIYDGRISDPYSEFVVECVSELSIYAATENGITSDSPLPTIRVRDGVDVPCFLEECLVPLGRTGQQLQVIMKLFELCNNAGTYDTHEEILPCLIGLSREHPWLTSPLTYDKGIIETMVLARASYYQRKLENIDNILTKFDFSSRQAASHGVSLTFVNSVGKNINQQASSTADDSLIPPLIDRRNQNLPDNPVDSEVLNTMDEYSYDEDLSESSDCSSSESSEEQNESEQLAGAPHSLEQSYLSAFDFSLSLSTDNIMHNFYQTGISCSLEDGPFKTNEKSVNDVHALNNETFSMGKSIFSHTPETQITSNEHDLWQFDAEQSEKDEKTWLNSHARGLEKLNTDSHLSRYMSKLNTSNKDQYPRETCAFSHVYSLHLCKLKFDSTIFSMNPTLMRGSFLDLRTLRKENGLANYRVSYFDFTSVKDPLKVCVDKLSGHPGPQFGVELSAKTEALAAGIDTSNRLKEEGYINMIAENDSNSCKITSPIHKKGVEEKHLSHPNISGGSAWESLLGRSGNIAYSSTRDYRTRLVAAVDMPLEFVIRKCLLDEILLQYKFLSKLTIKLLIEGFKLQEHFLALRCYHFMEVADWADLFIMSLWHRKWHVNEVDKRMPEIQGVLELSVQRSSCEGDPNKDRLFVYLKGDGIVNLSASATGIHSFDFLGLGYRVDWPVNIILTPAALKIYSEIFNFLIQVKLAVFSLSDAWCSLKSYRSKRDKEEVHQVSILIETRHKVNHFVSTLQQYVQSQLSQVSWCRFLQSLKHKVEDMVDLEAVHMAYLTESLHICFLSNETRSVAGIVQNILQCAMDFRSCLTGRILDADEKVINIFSEIDISQVHSIRRTFIKNLQELYLIYLQSPKHGEFGISRFWDCLNHNEYYAGVMSKQMGYSIFHP